MLNCQRIYFDSEPFVANGWPSLSARMRRVLELARSLSVSVYLPHAVREELEARWGAELQRHIDALRNDANTIKRDLKVVGGSFELGAVPSHSQSLAIYRQTIDATVARWGLQLVDLTSRSATYVFRLALARKAPFHRETDAGFKDTIILLSVIEHLEHDPAPSVLVTRDDRFGEADVSFFTRETVALRVLPLEAVEHELEAALDAIQREAMEQDRQKAWKAITGAWSALSEFLRADPERLREALGIFCAPSMGIGYLVKVREGGGRTDLSEAQGHSREGVSGGSVEREERADEQEPDTEAEPSGASGQMTAKLQRPRGGGVDPAVVL